jgi:hypothetical protein
MDRYYEPQEVIANVEEVEHGVAGLGTAELTTGLENEQMGQVKSC